MFLDELEKLKPGDRVLFRWNGFSNNDNGFVTKGYVLKKTKRYLFVKFPSHKRSKSIRKFEYREIAPHVSVADELLKRIHVDITAEIRKAMGEKNEWYTLENKEYRKKLIRDKDITKKKKQKKRRTR